MTTWIGGTNNFASNPNDWSPVGVPQPFDDVTMNGGTINIRGDDLASIVGMSVSGNSTINASNATIGSNIAILGANFGSAPTHVDINIKGTDTLYFNAFGELASETVNLVGNSTWVGGFTTNNHRGSAPVNVQGGGGSTFVNSGTSIVFYSGDSSVLNVDVGGTGTFLVGGSATLEFGKSVEAGQTVMAGPLLGIVQIDEPTKFLGLVQIANGPGEINLNGLARADSYSYQNDLLSIFGAGKLLDTLRLTSDSAFDVEKTSVGVTVFSASLSPPDPSGTLLPLHT